MIVAAREAELDRITRMDQYSAANAFVNGKLTVRGGPVCGDSILQPAKTSLPAAVVVLASCESGTAIGLIDERSIQRGPKHQFPLRSFQCVLSPVSRLADALDVGCGWGALVVHAAERSGVNAVGCTLSRDQYEFARFRRPGTWLGQAGRCSRIRLSRSSGPLR